MYYVLYRMTILIYCIDKFHIQWCLYTMMDLWNIINDMIWYDKDDTAWDNYLKHMEFLGISSW